MQASTPLVMLLITNHLLFILVAAASASEGSPMSCSQMCHVIEPGKNAYCGGRNLTQVPQCCSNSKRLDLRENNLRNLEGHPFYNFTHLRVVDISDNYLEELPSETFQGAVQLREVYLTNNQFTIIRRGTFTGSERIRAIYISNNRISSLQHSAFKELGHLQILYISQNELTSIGLHQFQHNTRLTHINLAHNRIEVLHKITFQNLRDLQALDLSYNKIQVINPSLFQALPNLRTLDISNNNLTSDVISESLLNAPSLEELYLHNNHITTIPDNLNEIHLAKIRLGNNPLTCDCAVKSLQEFYLTQRGQEWVEDVYCVSGQQFVSASLLCGEVTSSLNFKDDTTEQVNSDKSTPLDVFAVATLVITVMCSLICTVVICYWVKSCWRQRQFNRLKYPAPPPYEEKKYPVSDSKGKHTYV